MDWFAVFFLFAFITLHPWKIVGLIGSSVFGVRFFWQWIASERAKKSVIPIGFWEISLLGSLMTLSYFAIYQRDPVGVIQNLLPIPLYARNLYLKWKEVLKEKKTLNAEKPEDIVAE